MGQTPESLTDRPAPAPEPGANQRPARAGKRRGFAGGFVRSVPGVIGLVFLGAMFLACLGSLPWTLRSVREPGYAATPDRVKQTAFDAQNRAALRLPPSWWPHSADQAKVRDAAARDAAERRLADDQAVTIDTLLAVRRARAEVGAVGPKFDAAVREILTKAPELAAAGPSGVSKLAELRTEPTPAEVADATPWLLMGTDASGRDLLLRVLVGGGISLVIGLAAAGLSVFVGVMYGALSGYIGGWLDGLLMRIVDVMYGLPYVLLVVLLAVAVQGLSDHWERLDGGRREASKMAWIAGEIGVDAPPPKPVGQSVDADAEQGKLKPEVKVRYDAHVAGRAAFEAALAKLPPADVESLRERAQAMFPDTWTQGRRQVVNVVTLLVAIGGVAWLTMARVIRGQVLSLKAQPFVEAARAIGVGPAGVFGRHLLPNLVGPITVYATLTVPQAILQESFLSFLGIGVKAPLPSWGNLASDGLGELNTVQSNWWLLLFPCLMLGLTLLALNFVGEGLREALDPKRRTR